jgi:hypothetical protein
VSWRLGGQNYAHEFHEFPRENMVTRKKSKKQKPIEYSDVLGYIISMRNTELSPVLIDAVKTGRPL